MVTEEIGILIDMTEKVEKIIKEIVLNQFLLKNLITKEEKDQDPLLEVHDLEKETESIEIKEKVLSRLHEHFKLKSKNECFVSLKREFWQVFSWPKMNWKIKNKISKFGSRKPN